MEAQTKIVFGTPRPRRPARIRRRWGGGIFAREVRAAFPSLAALAGLMGIFAMIGIFGEYLREHFHNGYYSLFGCKGIHEIWNLIALIVFLTMGVLCGAEEAENGTADFARRLPVTRLHIYAAKTLGALCAVALWFVLASLLVNLIMIYGLGRFTSIDPYPMLLLPWKNFMAYLFLGLLLFFCGQAAGAWVERVIVAAVVGGATAVAVVSATFAAHANFYGNRIIGMTGWHAAVFLAVSLIAMVSACYRFQTREGR